MVKLKPQFMKKGGKPEFVVLTYAEFRRVVDALEDAQDFRDLRAARRANAGKKGISLEEYRRKHRV
jgi:hypothetical protein